MTDAPNYQVFVYGEHKGDCATPAEVWSILHALPPGAFYEVQSPIGQDLEDFGDPYI